ncbi:HEAT repeat domain-containing protein [Trichocoleus sp. DQ-A3]|uniref:HEAT repeat domain-containing protein n=1 Tax=Cyanophyceae TaxID=3028117 RepID=UPI0016848E94|nr:HEAT repeat domain-containing protein [Coleofasciculus sp. FACHB-125]MBD1901711.1 HEAT repeat domain-containing protein [Coleofasciculus sp. FACHB-125]
MVDWLVVWGVHTVAGFVFTEVLVPLAKGALEDYVKDFFKDSIKDFTGLSQKDTLQKAAGKALKEFLQLVQQELESADLSEERLKQYTESLNKSINDTSVKEILGSGFQYDCQAIDTKELSKIWYRLDLLSLPEDFDWGRIGKLYLKKVKAIIRESDELRAIFDSKNIEAIQQNTRELAGVPTEFDLKRYQEGLQERYSNLNLDSLDTRVYDYREKLKVWQVFIAQNVRECQEYLPQVYEMPKEHQKRLKESNQLEADVDPEEWERYKQVYYQQPIRSVLDIINDPQTYLYVVILGDPGSGKSTLLQYIALNWARTPLNTVIEQPIPLLIELRTYIRNRDSGECKDFLEFFHKGCGIVCRLNQLELHELLKAGKVLVMFDGLDEVFDPVKREEVITDIHRFTNDYPKARVMVTSRIIGYKPQRLRDAEFRHFMLQDLEPDQIQDFIYRWHELTFTDEADKVRKRERLQRAIETSSAIGELAGNPLLLTMMAILNRNQELPRDRPELYNQASRLLLHQWDVEQKLLENPRVDSVTIDYKDKQAILRQVAYHMQAADKGLAGNLMQGEDLEKILTGYLKNIEVSQARTVARLLIEQLRSRNFILCFLGADSYAFVHRTFLEYFCACEFIEQFGKRGLEGGLTLEEFKTEVFGKHWQDESWHEVLRLIAGMIDTSFVGQIIDYLISLNGEAEKFTNVFLASECLSEVRNRFELMTVSVKLLSSLKDLIKYDPNYDNSKGYFKGEDRVRAIRTQAVSVIAANWKDDQATLSWLKYLAQFDDDWVVRVTAVEELAKGWKDNSGTLPWLKTLAWSVNYGAVRVEAVDQVVQGWKEEPETLPWLKTLAKSDEYPTVRMTALSGWCNAWKDDPEILPTLKGYAQSDKDSYVRLAAISQLADGWKGEPGMFEFLCNCALNAPFEREDYLEYNPRQTALEGILEQYPNHPQTLPLLLDRAVNDPDYEVREFAVQELAHGWNDEPDMFEFLHNRAVNDPFEREGDWEDNPRQLALEIIIKNYPHHPQTLPLLRDRSVNDPDQKVREFATEKLKNWSKSCE